MKCRLAAGLTLAVSLTAAAVPPTAPVIPPAVVQLLPEAEPALADPVKLAERIEKNTKAATAKLGDRDPGADARNAQRQTLRDLDELLKQAENPPPPPMSGDGPPPPPMGGEGGQPPPAGGGGDQPPKDGKPSPKAGKQPGSGKGGGQPPPSGGKPGGKTPMPGGGDEPMPAGGAKPGGSDPAGGGGGQSKPAPPLDEPIAKQVWGHLPDTVRKQMSQYYKEQFMPRYGGLLREYYSSLAEREKAGKR